MCGKEKLFLSKCFNGVLMVIMNVRYVLRHSKMIVFGHAVGTTTIIIDNIGYILIF